MPWMIDLTLRDPKTGDKVRRTLPAIDVHKSTANEDAKTSVAIALPAMIYEAVEKELK